MWTGFARAATSTVAAAAATMMFTGGLATGQEPPPPDTPTQGPGMESAHTPSGSAAEDDEAPGSVLALPIAEPEQHPHQLSPKLHPRPVHIPPAVGDSSPTSMGERAAGPGQLHPIHIEGTEHPHRTAPSRHPWDSIHKHHRVACKEVRWTCAGP